MDARVDDGAKQDESVNTLSDLVEDLKLAKEKTYERDHFKLPEWLQGYECPFLWHSEEVRGLGPEIVIARHIEKLDDLKIDDPGFCVERFVTMLKLVLEYYVTDQMLECWANMDEVEVLLNKAGQEAEASNDDHLYLKVKRVLHHVIFATKANLLVMLGQIDEAKQILADVTIVEDFNNSERASLCSMKARYFLYSGYENGENLGVGFAKQALDLEPEDPEWAYIMAKVLRQRRKATPHSSEIPREELLLLEKSVKNSDDVKYKVYLAQVYIECSSAAFRAYKDNPAFFKSDMFKTIQQFQTTALSLFKKAAESHPDSPAVLRRVGYGIINLPKKMLSPEDYQFALDCLLKSLQFSENQMTLHVLGTYYVRHGNDYEKALEYFEKTVRIYRSHAGLCDKVRLKFQMDPDYDPVPDLRNGLEWELKKANRIQVVSQLGTYFLFIKRDLIKCIETFRQSLEDEENIPHLKAFKCVFLRMYNPINLFHYLTNECLLYLRTEGDESKPDESKPDETKPDETKPECDLKLVKEFYQKMIKIDPESAKVNVNPELINNLLSMSRSIQYQDRNARGAQSRGFGRDRGRGYFPRRGDGGYNSGQNREWRGRDGDRYQNRGNRYQGSRGPYRGRGGRQESGEQSEADETKRDGGNRWNSRYQGQRGPYRGRAARGNAGERGESCDGDQNNQYQRNRQTNEHGSSGHSSETNWRQK